MIIDFKEFPTHDRSFEIDFENNFWFNSRENGLIKVDINKNKTFYDTTNSGIISNAFYSNTVLKNGDIYVATFNGLSVYSKTVLGVDNDFSKDYNIINNIVYTNRNSLIKIYDYVGKIHLEK